MGFLRVALGILVPIRGQRGLLPGGLRGGNRLVIYQWGPGAGGQGGAAATGSCRLFPVQPCPAGLGRGTWGRCQVR